jgi:tRNA 2-selenouridine synthase
MPSRSGTGDSALRTAHPHDIGVQEFASYALIVDARSRAEYDEDHIPGALSLPLGPVGRRGRGSRRGVDSARKTIVRSGGDAPSDLLDVIKGLRPGDAILLYGAGADAALADAASSLRSRDLVVDVLAGGWANYRRWVEAGLEVLPRQFAFRQLAAPPASTVEQVVDALSELGEQLIDIGACARTGRSPGTARARVRVLSQPALETWLLNTLRHRETDRVVWVIGALELPPALHLPPAMREALARAPELRLDDPQSESIRSQLERMLQRLHGDDSQSSP